MITNFTKSIDAQSLAQTHRTVSTGHFKIDHSFALEACGEAKNCLQCGEFERAEQLAVAAITARPSCKLAYHILGQVFDKLDQADDARECHRGRLPARLVTQYFQATPVLSDASRQVFDRLEVFPAERHPLPRPGSINDQLSPVFNRKAINANPGFVDNLDNARLWHDSSNTLVLDVNGNEIAEHTLGDTAVLKALQKTVQPKPLKGRVVLLGARGVHNYYHWIADIIPRLGLLKAAGFVLRSTDKFVVSRASTSFARGLLERAGISNDQIIQSELLSPYFAADELIVPNLSNTMGYTMGQWLPAIVQETILGHLSVENAGDRKLYISRNAGTTAGRTLGNQQEVEEFFVRRGFEIVMPEQMSVTRQAQLFSTASVIAGPHGAGLSNIVYCAPGTKVIEFYGAHLAPCYWAISALSRLEYYQHCCLSGESKDILKVSASVRRSAGFSIPLDAADAILNRAGC